MLIEAAKGGHTSVVQLLLDYPHSIMMAAPHPHSTAVATGVTGAQTQTPPGAVSSTGGLHEVPEAVRVVPQEDLQVNASQSVGAAKSSGSQAGQILFHKHLEPFCCFNSDLRNWCPRDAQTVYSLR
jgi:ankyrin repeat domain-containing protein 17